MTDLKPNAELAYKVLDLTAAHPDRLNMSNWATDPTGRNSPVVLATLTAANTCGTTACFAGWAVAVSGYGASTAGDVYRDGHIVSEDIQAFAAGLLRISEWDAENNLFFADEDDLPDRVFELFGPRPVTDAHRDDACRAIAAELDRHPDGL